MLFSRYVTRRRFELLKLKGETRVKAFISTADMTTCQNSQKPHLAAVIQLTCTSDKLRNLEKSVSLIRKAVCDFKAQMVFLPEAFDFVGESTKQTFELAEPANDTLENDSSVLKRYKTLAKELDIWLSLGGLHRKIRESNLLANTHMIISGSGEVVSKYEKIHLFDIQDPDNVIRLKESNYVAAGSRITPPVGTPLGHVGLGICYDVRFPEFSLALTRMGADILTYPSAFTVPTGSAHWEVLLRARAVENQCYVVAAAQTGVHNPKRASYGRSMIIDPWGAIVAQCSEGESIAVAEIDHDLIRRVRNNIPVASHRRNDLYSLYVDGETFVPYNKEVNDQKPPPSKRFGPIEIPSCCVVMENQTCYAIVNRKPVLPLHMLVLPKAPKKRLKDLTTQETSDLFNLARKVQCAVESVRGAASSTVTVQDGLDAGQTVNHVHVHVLARIKGDFEQNDDIYKELATHDKETVVGWRSLEEMSREAEMLKDHLLKLEGGGAICPMTPRT